MPDTNLEPISRRSDYYKKVRLSGNKLDDAIKYACDNRNAEIERYWTRTAYFWALLAVLLSGYYLIITGSDKTDNEEKQSRHCLATCTMSSRVLCAHPKSSRNRKFNSPASSFNPATNHREIYAFVIACTGLLFSLAWFLANKGSKYWQENWEAHVDVLLKRKYGQLFLTIKKEKWSLLGGGMFSVTRINILTSLLVTLLWLALLLWQVWKLKITWFFGEPVYWTVTSGIIAILCCAVFTYLVRTKKPKLKEDKDFKRYDLKNY